MGIWQSVCPRLASNLRAFFLLCEGPKWFDAHPWTLLSGHAVVVLNFQMLILHVATFLCQNSVQLLALHQLLPLNLVVETYSPSNTNKFTKLHPPCQYFCSHSKVLAVQKVQGISPVSNARLSCRKLWRLPGLNLWVLVHTLHYTLLVSFLMAKPKKNPHRNYNAKILYLLSFRKFECPLLRERTQKLSPSNIIPFTFTTCLTPECFIYQDPQKKERKERMELAHAKKNLLPGHQCAHQTGRGTDDCSECALT
jgi:hypothetical protein